MNTNYWIECIHPLMVHYWRCSGCDCTESKPLTICPHCNSIMKGYKRARYADMVENPERTINEKLV